MTAREQLTGKRRVLSRDVALICDAVAEQEEIAYRLWGEGDTFFLGDDGLPFGFRLSRFALLGQEAVENMLRAGLSFEDEVDRKAAEGTA